VKKITKNAMKILKTISDLRQVKKGCVLTIGNFDGIHIGHQAILTNAKKVALQRKTPLVIMTFDPHPLAILHPQKNPRTLTPLPLKKHILAEFGVNYLFTVRTTRKLLNLSPCDFVRKFLVEHIQPSVVVEGESFNFGLNRTGSIHTLQKLAASCGFEVVMVKAKEVKLSTGEFVKVSSTIIRDLLAKGRVADAAVALRRPYRLVERVVPGRGKGKKLGFPTANMKPPRQIIPAKGVYAGFVKVADTRQQILSAGRKNPAAFSIGRGLMYADDESLLIEAHLLMENVGRLYGKWLAMDFVERIRSQKKFKTDKDLSAQIAKDCKKAKRILTTGWH
jgi:riboflavin kinase/FMN adenylyltransferase